MGELKVIWGDRVHEAAVDDECVMLSGDDNALVILSHAEMRELVLGWQRYLDMKEEQEAEK